MRDRGYEHDLMTAAERQAGLMGLGFPEQVAARLELMQERHGDRWRSMPVRRLLAEIREEALDVGGWSALCAQQALDELDRRGVESLELRLKLQEIASKGAEVENLVRQAFELLPERSVRVAA